MDLLIQLASPILTAVMAVGGAYIAFNNRLTILETKSSNRQPESDLHHDDNQSAQLKEEVAQLKADVAEIKVDLAVIKSGMTSLTEETRKHNNVIERTYKLEAIVDALEKKI